MPPNMVPMVQGSGAGALMGAQSPSLGAAGIGQQITPQRLAGLQGLPPNFGLSGGLMPGMAPRGLMGQPGLTAAGLRFQTMLQPQFQGSSSMTLLPLLLLFLISQ